MVSGRFGRPPERFRNATLRGRVQKLGENFTVGGKDMADLEEDGPGQHTPGPWEATRKFRGSRCITTRVGAHAKVYVGSKGSLFADPTGEANARLIAAAPDLLAASRKALDECDFSHFGDEAEAALHAAIEKATR